MKIEQGVFSALYYHGSQVLTLRFGRYHHGNSRPPSQPNQILAVSIKKRKLNLTLKEKQLIFSFASTSHSRAVTGGKKRRRDGPPMDGMDSYSSVREMDMDRDPHPTGRVRDTDRNSQEKKHLIPIEQRGMHTGLN